MKLNKNTNSLMTNKTGHTTPQGAGRKQKGRWVMTLLIVVILVISLLFATTRGRTSDIADEQTVTVRRGDLIVTVTESGSIRARDSIQYKCRVERRRGGVDMTILDIVPPGTYVTQEDVDAGMVLVELDSSSLKDQLQEEEMELAGDQENFTASKEAYDIQVIQNESDVATARLRVRFALMDMEKYLGKELAQQMTENISQAENLVGHVTPFLRQVKNDPNLLEGSSAGQELKGLRDEIVLAEGNLKTAENTLAGSEKLHEADYVSNLELERDRLSVTSRQFSQQNARVNLDLFLIYDFPKNAEQYLSDYIEAGRELERTFAECRSKLAQAQALLNNAQEQFRSQTNYVNDLKLQIEYCTIRAIAPGLVIYGEGGSGDTFRMYRGGSGGGIIAEGEVVYEGQTIIAMPDTAAMIAEVNVHETEVDKVRPGQPVQIVMDAFPDKILRGEVLEVAPLPDQQRSWMNPDLKVYKTLVTIDGTHDFLKTRMSCKVEVLVRRLNDVLLVPIQVVANRGGRKVCYVAASSGPQEREVATGAFTDTLVQIIGGLEDGEEVLLNPPLFEDLSGEPAFLRQQQGWDKNAGTNVDSSAESSEPQEGGSDPTDQSRQRPPRGEGQMDGQRPQPSEGQMDGQRPRRGERPQDQGTGRGPRSRPAPTETPAESNESDKQE
ncbi:MAG: HlyD family efflux transporter periplasmic adaptor subunit [Phycisphaerae bacterium]|nr:HlyD family efflux transporter periplasmic adaptor subunit [Phycisphaerae bacterium]